MQTPDLLVFLAMEVPAANTQPEKVRFGAFEADLRSKELRKHGIRLKLPNQSFVVLEMLMERPGQLVTREELRERLWPANTFVEYDQGLNAAVNRLRDALGDSADEPRFIETLPRRGYRLIATVEADAVKGQSPTHPAPALVPDSPLPDSALEEKAPDREPGHQDHVGWLDRGRRGFMLPIFLLLGLLLLAGVAIQRLWKKENVASVTPMRVIALTSLPGQEVEPAFSPDGSQIAFAWKPDGNRNGAGHAAGFDLYLKTFGSERMLRLTDHPAKWISPAWSPDGSMIAFARWAEDGSGIFEVPVLGGAERKLADATFWYEPLMKVSWSPDAKTLAYWSSSGVSHVYLVPLDTLQPRALAFAPQCWDTASPAFSPDGKSLALVCTSSIAVYGIYLVPLDGGPLRLLASVMGYPGGLTWSQDGGRLIFANDSGDGGQLWQMGTDGHLARLPFGEEATEPAVARNRLAYARGSKTIDIWRIDLAAAHPEQSATKLIFSTRVQRVPQYSPDGTKILFESNRSGTHEIWMADSDGNNPVQLTAFNGPQTGRPSWCSDGRRIAFDSRASGVSAIYVEDVGERLPRQVQTSTPNLAIPAWSGDCRWLYASNGHNALYRLPANGGDAERATGQPSFFGVVSSGRLFFNVNEPRDIALWSRRENGGEEKPVEGIPRLDYSETWTVNSRGIYYTKSEAHNPTINFYDFALGASKRVVNLPQNLDLSGGIAVSPYGRWLLYTQTDDVQSDLMLVQDFR